MYNYTSKYLNCKSGKSLRKTRECARRVSNGHMRVCTRGTQTTSLTDIHTTPTLPPPSSPSPPHTHTHTHTHTLTHSPPHPHTPSHTWSGSRSSRRGWTWRARCRRRSSRPGPGTPSHCPPHPPSQTHWDWDGWGERGEGVKFVVSLRNHGL